jgi:hypothetical protein
MPFKFKQGLSSTIGTKQNLFGSGLGVKDSADFSKDAYQSNRQDNLHGYTYLPEESDEQIAVYKDDTNKNIMVALKGTSTMRDVITDLKLATGIALKDDEFYWRASRTIRKLKSKYKGYTIYVSGHSLGGAVARKLAEQFPDIKATGFNPGSGIPQLLSGSDPKNFTTIRNTGDVVSLLGKSSNENSTRTTDSLNPFGGIHSIDSFTN